MQRRRLLPVFIAMATALSLAPLAPAQTSLKSPQSVRIGLRLIDQVVNHTGRLIAAANYAQVPRETEEFTEGVADLRATIAGEPAEFRSTIEPLLAEALQTARALRAAAKGAHPATITAAHERFSAAVKSVIAAFPDDLRPRARANAPAGLPPAGP